MRLRLIGIIARLAGAERATKQIARLADRAVARKGNVMPIALLLPLIHEVVRLINNLIESEPIEMRQVKSVVIFRAARPLYIWLIPKDMRDDVDALVAAIGTSPQVPEVTQ